MTSRSPTGAGWGLGVALGIGLLATGGWLLWRSGPAPEAVSPVAPERLDPDVFDLVRRSVAAVDEDPRSAELHGRLGMVYEANALWLEARDSYLQATRLDPDEILWRFHHGIAVEQSGDYEGALEIYRAASERTLLPALQQRLGWNLVKTGELEAALGAFEKVVTAAPREPEGYVGVAAVHRLRGQPAAAIPQLERALELDPGHRGARHQLGLAYLALGRPEEAKRELARGLQAEPRQLPDGLSERISSYAVGLAARIERAEALRAAGRFAEMTKLLEAGLTSHPDNLTLLNGLATAHLALGDAAQAHRLLERAFEIDPNAVETLMNMAGWALASDRPSAATEYADRALALAPRLARLHALRAQALIAQSRSPEAIGSLEEAIRLEIRDPALYLVLGVLYSAGGEWQAAGAIYDGALAQWPDLVPALIGRGEVALALGDSEAAGIALEKARSLEPGHPQIAILARQLESRRSPGG